MEQFRVTCILFTSLFLQRQDATVSERIVSHLSPCTQQAERLSEVRRQGVFKMTQCAIVLTET
jgi:hypothetical protein